MALGKALQIADAYIVQTGRTGTATFAAAPTPGNLLFTAITTDKGPSTFTVDADFTGIASPLPLASASVSGHGAYRIADGTAADTSVTWSYSDGGTGLGARVVLIEIDLSSGTAALAGAPTGVVETTAVTTLSTDPGLSASAHELAIAVTGIDTSTSGKWTSTDPRWNTGWEGIATARGETSGSNDNGGSAVGVATHITTATGASNAVTATWSAGDQAYLYAYRYSLTGVVASPEVSSQWLGYVTDDTATVAYKMTNTTSAKLAVSTTADMANPIYGIAVTPNAQGVAKLQISGLVPRSFYYYGVHAGGGILTAGRGSFKTGGNKSFSFATSSCRKEDGPSGADPDAWDRLRAKGPNFFIYTGDMHYRNINSTDASLYRAAIDEAITRPRASVVFKDIPIVYTWDDHDFCGNNSDGTFIGKATVQQVYRERVPHLTLPATDGGIYHTFTHGRTRFIVLDTRSYRSPSANADDVNKTMLGAGQKQWFKDLLASTKEPLTFIISSVAWISGETSSDNWGAYNTERKELVPHLTGASTNIVWVAGDAHMLAADSGVNSPDGNAVIQAAALSSNSSIKGGPYSQGTYDGSNQYGIVNVTDNNTEMIVAFSGYDALDTPRISLTKKFTVNGIYGEWALIGGVLTQITETV